MSEEYEEVYDYKKIIIVVAILIGSIVPLYFILIEIADFVDELPDIELPEMEIPSVQNKDIKSNYMKFLDFGISADDIIDIQDMECVTFDNEALISKDPKFTMIFEERRAEC